MTKEDRRKFALDSPMGLGWIMGSVSLDMAIDALARSERTSRQGIISAYGIEETDFLDEEHHKQQGG